MAGALSVKFIEKHANFHQGLCIGFIITSLFSVIFNNISGLYSSSLALFISSVGYGLIDTFGNISAIECFKKTNLDAWLQFLHGCFGIGGLIGPYLVYIF